MKEVNVCCNMCKLLSFSNDLPSIISTINIINIITIANKNGLKKNGFKHGLFQMYSANALEHFFVDIADFLSFILLGVFSYIRSLYY